MNELFTRLFVEKPLPGALASTGTAKDKLTKYLVFKNPDFTLKVVFPAHLLTQIKVKYIFRHNHWKALVKTLLWVALRYDHIKIYIYIF